jgi:biopolymer transport protein ExbD
LNARTLVSNDKGGNHMALALARRARPSFAPTVDPNVIPFIDVLLVLLIIFMVTAPKPTTDLRVDLPRQGPPVILNIPPTVVYVRSTPGGARTFLGSEEVARAELPEATLAFMLAANPVLTEEDALTEGRVFVRADLDAAYQDVVGVVEDLQEGRFQRVGIYAQNADAE